jgi:hypothetical protein
MNTDDQNLTLTDLSSIKNLIEVACNRGAFRAEEMTTVGAVYEKLAGFLNNVAEQARAAAEADNQLSQGESQ